MSYTELDWLRDQAENDGVELRDLVGWMRQDGRAIVRSAEHAAMVAHVRGKLHDHESCILGRIHWDKEASDWDVS